MDTHSQIIKDNLTHIQHRIAEACHRSGRNVADVRLVVVTKGQPIEVIRTALDVGMRIFGENYPEEALAKITALRNYGDIEWHMIGHLQSRKIKMIMDNFYLLHSLDSLSLAVKLDRQFSETGKPLKVLVEFNLGDENSKYGFPAAKKDQWDDVLPDIEAICKLKNIFPCGLMTMPPLSPNPEESRMYFVRLVELQHYLVQKIPEVSWKELSMGTSSDFEVAITEGATYVRIGQAILGPRITKV